MAGQSASVTGQGHVVIQVVGDGNVVGPGVRPLWLYRDHLQARPPKKLLDLLVPRLQCVPFVGREAELAELQAWLDRPEPVLVRGLTGGAGAGKTRLAIALCGRMAELGWDAGFVDKGELRHLDEALTSASLRADGQVLAVVDYALSCAQPLRKLLVRLVRRPLEKGRLRLLVLEREAEAGAGWWAELRTGRSNAEYGLEDLFEPAEPQRLVPMAAEREAEAIVSAAISGAAPLVQGPSPADTTALAAAVLAQSTLRAPLDLLMSAVGAVVAGDVDFASQARTDQAFFFAQRELDRIAMIEGVAEPARSFLAHLAILATLRGGVAGADAIGFAQDEWRALGRQGAFDPEQLARQLVAALPDAGSGVAPILPDLIGEAALIDGLASRPGPIQGGVIARSFEAAPAAASQAVVRTVQDFVGRTEVPLAWVDVLIGRADDPAALFALADALPEQTVALRERAAAIHERIADLFRPMVDAGVGEARPFLATSLNNLAVRLSALGRREEALARAEEAVAIRRELAATRPDAFRSDLASSLNNLANRLSELGRREEALARTEEATALYRELAAARPDAFRPYLAASLNNLAVRLSALGRREEALAWAEEAVAIRRELAAARPDAFRPDLASSLNNLANRLSELGRREEALAWAEEATALYHELAAARPDAFRPDLAASLNNLANSLSELGRREAALAWAEEAVAIRRELAAARPDAFRPDLAGSLNNLANRLSELGRREEAMARAEEAVALYHELAAARPDAFRPYLAGSLNNLATMLSELGRREAALARAEEAVALCRELAAARPDAFRPDLAQSLNNLAIMLSALGRREEALARAEEAVAIRRELAATRPDAFRSDLASSLNNLANSLSELGRREEALARAEEAVAIRRELAAARPDAFRPNLAMSLSVLGDCLEAVERLGNALAADEEALATLLPIFERHPQALGDRMATYARDYLRRCEKAGRSPDGELLAAVMAVFQRLNAPQDSASPTQEEN